MVVISVCFSLTLGFLCEFEVFVRVFIESHHLLKRNPETKMIV